MPPEFEFKSYRRCENFVGE